MYVDSCGRGSWGVGFLESKNSGVPSMSYIDSLVKELVLERTLTEIRSHFRRLSIVSIDI